ncbi:LytR family transcriptional regulator [Streptomyces inhibens]|uniref:LytR family transcriptional regulator n=1 Tax=Streptomyces inhibens TaxID=2293571 RepID=A0A371PSZ2_STRIH|nr:LCP family protein [Streptomyces inhibens]REK85263.1 LytR family transcriptional regulator [Streptomyces inhibens]
MNEWPNGWSGDQSGNRYGHGSNSAEPEGARAMPQVRRDAGPGYQRHEPPLPPSMSPRRGASVPPQQSQGYDDGYNTGQVYGGGRGGGNGYDDGYGDGRGGRPRPRWGRRIKWTVITVVVVLAVGSVATYFWADGKLRRQVDLSKVIDRPEAGDGTNYLIVGSDSREGMSAEEKKKLHTGSAEGKRTDSMMILHDGSNGPTLISLPRDSDVEIPSFVGSDSGKKYPGTGRHTKLNAAYAEDGPELLVRTVEYNTKLHIDHYVEIGFAGFANIVDAIGGVEMNIPKAFKDKDSGADFPAGKQTLNGQQALAFVRTRHAFATQDLERTKNQQKFLSALASQTATPGTLLNPFKLYPTMGAGLDTLIVDKDMGLWDLGQMFFAMKGVTGGEGKSLNMPVSGSSGGNLLWDKAKLQQLVQQLKNDEKVTVSGN